MAKHVNKTNNGNSAFAKITRPKTKMNNKSLSNYNQSPKKICKKIFIKKVKIIFKNY